MDFTYLVVNYPSRKRFLSKALFGVIKGIKASSLNEYVVKIKKLLILLYSLGKRLGKREVSNIACKRCFKLCIVFISFLNILYNPVCFIT